MDILSDFIYRPSKVCEQHDLQYLLVDKRQNNPYKYVFPKTIQKFKSNINRYPILIINPKKSCL